MTSVLNASTAANPPPASLHAYFERSALQFPDHIALEVAGRRWSYRELDRAANGMAWALRHAGLGPGRRIGLALPRGGWLFPAMLAIQKSGASYVPIEPLLPAARRRWLAEDAALDLIVGERPVEWSGPCWGLAELAAATAASAEQPPPSPIDPEQECYVLYTSGSSGRPKGVPISQGNICAFLEAALPVYHVGANDRVYQGVSLSFDFAIEEIWPAWAAGATLIASERTPQPVAEELDELLRAERITVLCAVPTVLATLGKPWAQLRQLVVSGEACPAELANRWAQPGIRMLNAYGPTEITVSATIGELHRNQPVTLGHALPHLRLSVRDANMNLLPDGATGELCIAGSGVARGYLNRPEQTEQSFVSDPDGPGLLYRSGDLVSRLPDGRFLYFGRADDQIKLRGQRIEPGEIESVLLSDPAIERAAVLVWCPEGQTGELAAYVALRSGYLDGSEWREGLTLKLAQNLSSAMLPSLLDVLTVWPELTNGKTDRRSLPPPSGKRLRVVAPLDRDEALDTLGERIRGVWARVLGLDAVPSGSHFFNDLGGHSLSAARVVSTVRSEFGVNHLAVSDLYRLPILSEFAAFCSPRTVPAPEAPYSAEAAPNRNRWLCGIAQLGVLMAVTMVFILPALALISFSQVLSPLVMFCLWGAVLPLWTMAQGLLLPYLANLLLGPLKPGRYPLWGWMYFKFWLKRKLMQTSPAGLLFAGHRWWPAYLRSLGATIGEHGVIASHYLAVPELLDIGPRVHIDANAGLIPYRIERGWLLLAAVTVGPDACIGCGAVLQAGAVLPAAAVLAPLSALFAGDITKAAWVHVGNPASPAREAPPSAPGRHPSASAWGLFCLMLLPSAAMWPLSLFWLVEGGLALSNLWLAPIMALASVVTLSWLVALTVRLALRRPMALAIPLDGQDYRRKWLADRAIELHQTLVYPLYDTIFTAPWLRLLGMRVGRNSEISTLSHFDPTQLSLGDECFVADLAAVGVASHACGEMRMSPTVVGNRSFVGNGAVLPSGFTLHDGVLLGVYSCPPTPEVTRDCLGVPAFDLPGRETLEAADALTFHPAWWRLVGRSACDVLRILGPPTVLTISYVVWFHAAISWLGGWLIGGICLTFVYLLLQLALVLFCMLAKWLVIGRYRPRVAAVWTHFVWRTQWITGWYEAIAVPALVDWLTGTPWWSICMRGFGCHIGHQVFSDTSFITEFDLVHLDDHCEVGEVAVLQTHLFEDRIMKCGIVHLEEGANVGPRSVVLYGGALGRGSHLAALSLAMKGERLPPAGHFRGVPAAPAAPAKDLPQSVYRTQ